MTPLLEQNTQLRGSVHDPNAPFKSDYQKKHKQTAHLKSSNTVNLGLNPVKVILLFTLHSVT